MDKKNHSTISIGLMTPYTGIANIYGQEIANAGMIACQQINETGGVLGKKLELIIIDDGSMPDQAVRAANTLIDEYNCQAIIGNLLSNSRIDVANKVSLPRKIIYLNFSFYEGSIFNKYFFNFSALPNQQLQNLTKESLNCCCQSSGISICIAINTNSIKTEYSIRRFELVS